LREVVTAGAIKCLKCMLYGTGSLTYGYTVHPLAASASSLDPLLSPRAADRLPVGIPIDTMARCSLLEPPPKNRAQVPVYLVYFPLTLDGWASAQFF
jgi:hypothetical protein